MIVCCWSLIPILGYEITVTGNFLKIPQDPPRFPKIPQDPPPYSQWCSLHIISSPGTTDGVPSFGITHMPERPIKKRRVATPTARPRDASSGRRSAIVSSALCSAPVPCFYPTPSRPSRRYTSPYYCTWRWR